jgi:hypothetical protein
MKVAPKKLAIRTTDGLDKFEMCELKNEIMHI